ncbi:uncharacterized protein TRUGW13939_08501 [Talaromyces rugulosus]|uniref:Zinc finger CHCC-type domain-containing protein n=1 Tax=Talaromyces rugulosus TaxID=121627 RepID=A0A7H8R9G5_TALRU|nr:uncharacterized protein TRUGW13939_08501 [Talaromyces rugulosus]QKX61353.1 hypothetical protein TRUGW13939_08501 [Talaromyces rugulosus]
MLSSARTRIASAALSAARPGRLATTRASYSVSASRFNENTLRPNDPAAPRKPVPNVSATNAVPVESVGAFDGRLAETPEAGERSRELQAPNRASTWAKNQAPREEAMTGPRFEQTIMELQPQPYAAIELIHQQPVRWSKSRVVSCDGGGGPHGHPRIFINTDKPEIATCGYCGLPFAQEKHKAYLKSLPSTSYPLEPTGHPAEVEESQRVTDGAFEQR